MVVSLRLKKDERGNVSLDKSLMETVEDLPPGSYDFYIAEEGYTTTVSQRRLFWMWMGCLEYWSGETRIKWHDHYVRKFLPPYKHGISDISTKAMSHFMDQIQADAMTEYGVNLPLPRDREVYNEFVLEYKYR